MKRDVQRDFAQLRDHLRSLSDLRDGFVVGPTKSQNASFQLVPIVWDHAERSEPDIRITAVSSNFSEVALFIVKASEDKEIEIYFERFDPNIRDRGFLNGLTDLIHWLENSIGGGHYLLQGALFPTETKILKQSFWELSYPETCELESPVPQSGKQAPERTTARFNYNNIPDDRTEVLTAGPSISPMEISFSDSAVRTGWNDKHSDYISIFENDLAGFLGVKYALATSSCTGALHLSLISAGIGPGDEVLVPDITWVATGSVVRYVGATPVFVDIDPISWTMKADEVRKLITPRTKAIIPVHLYGIPAEMEKILLIAQAHKISVIEDAAPSLGAKSGARYTGTLGSFGCFSFQGAKMLVTGEGGMLVTNSEELFLKAKQLQEHGRRPGSFWIEKIGYKYKMSNVQAAIGVGQVARLSNQIERKKEVNSWYREFLDGSPGISFQTASSTDFSIDWMTSIQLTGDLAPFRDHLMQYLKVTGIDSRPVFPQMSKFSIWGSPNSPDNQVAQRLAESALNLPSGVNLRKQTVRRVAEEILRFASHPTQDEMRSVDNSLRS